jgi:hypothetical protein
MERENETLKGGLWSTMLVTVLGSWGEPVPRGHSDTAISFDSTIGTSLYTSKTQVRVVQAALVSLDVISKTEGYEIDVTFSID